MQTFLIIWAIGSVFAVLAVFANGLHRVHEFIIGKNKFVYILNILSTMLSSWITIAIIAYLSYKGYLNRMWE